MNIAIIIGVSEYNTQPKLPSCKNDSDIVFNLISKSEKYQEILLMNELTDSSNVKEKLYTFIEMIESQKVELNEVFFYFTGHGYFSEDQFYLILSDFQTSKRHQTALKNSEIDSIVRKLNCKLFVKIIDACQSGSQYIKSVHSLKSSLDKASHTFNKCYFLSSSTQNQASYATDKISHFTNSLINSLRDSQKVDVRYSDVINYISDDFNDDQFQTPLFITQANHTEIFIKINDNINAFLHSLSENKLCQHLDNNTPEYRTSPLLSAIKSNEKEFITKEIAIQIIEAIKVKIENFKFKIDEFYDINLEFNDSYKDISNKKEIINWINNNPGRFFIKKITEYQPKKKNLLGNKGGHFLNRFNPIIEQLTNPNFYEENELVITDFDINISDLPFKTASIIFDKKYENLVEYKFSLIYFISNQEIAFFYYLTNYDMADWDESFLNTDFNWQYSHFKFSEKDIIFDNLNEILDEIDENILNKLNNQFKQEC